MITTPFADFDYYKNTYKGDIFEDEDTFERWALRASEEIEYQTLKKASQAFEDSVYLDEIKFATCGCAETLYTSYLNDTAGVEANGGRIESENNDGFSVKYKYDDKSNTDNGYKTKQREMSKVINRYLMPTGLS